MKYTAFLSLEKIYDSIAYTFRCIVTTKATIKNIVIQWKLNIKKST